MRPARAELLRVSRSRRKPSKLATASAPRQEVLVPAVSNHKKSVRHFVAAGGRNILYGLWRNLWHRRHRSRRRIRPRDPHPSAYSNFVEPTHRLHDWRAVQRSAVRGRVLRLGAPRHGQLLGISGSMALAGGLLICMWNYMGWDNASTIATEVERPQRTYPRAMLAAVGIVGLTYILPVATVWLTGLAPTAWETGSWADIAGMLGGPLLRIALVLGGMMSGFGMFNALVMSYSRLPLAMAQDGMLPRIFAKLHPRSRAPWVAIIVCAIGWATCLGLGFERLVTIDILLYGASLLLEFAALIVLRVREPELHRPFRVPGGTFGAIAVGIPPMLLLGFDLARSHTEQVLGMSSLAFGLILLSAGVSAYLLNHALKPAGWSTAERPRTAT